MSLRFDGQTTYILPLTNKHGLSRFKPEKLLTEDSFSFCCTMQVEWDNIDSEKAGGVIAFNGMHTGIMVRHPSEDDYFIQADIWVEEDGIAKPKQVFYKVPLDKKDGWIDVVLSVDQKKKKIALRVDGAMESVGLKVDQNEDYGVLWRSNPGKQLIKKEKAEIEKINEQMNPATQARFTNKKIDLQKLQKGIELIKNGNLKQSSDS